MPTHFKGTEEEVRSLNAYINLMRASGCFYAKVERVLGLQGISVSQFGVLETLLHLGPMCQKDIAGKILKTEGNLTMVISNLEKRGLVKRSREGKDRRYVTIALSPKGRSLIAEIFPLHVSVIAREFRHITSEEQEKLRDICRKLGKGIQTGKKQEWLE